MDSWQQHLVVVMALRQPEHLSWLRVELNTFGGQIPPVDGLILPIKVAQLGPTIILLNLNLTVLS